MFPDKMMLWFWLLLSKQLAALCDGSALHQMPGSITVQTNQLAILSCETKIHPTNKRVYWLRQREAPSPHSRHEFLAFWDSKHQAAVYGQGVGLENLTVSQNGPRSTLNLTKMIPSDSGIYFCMTIGNPQLVFGKGTHLTVVDVLPTNTKPTRKPTPKKRVCRFPNSLTQKACWYEPAALLASSPCPCLSFPTLSCSQPGKRLQYLSKSRKIRIMVKFKVRCSIYF